MSHSTSFCISVLNKHDLVNYFGVEVAALFDKEATATDASQPNLAEGLKKLRKTMIASTRWGRFNEGMGRLLDLTGHERLRFLANQACDYTYVHVVKCDLPGMELEIKTEYKYSVFRERFDPIIQDLSSVVAWCRSHPEKLIDIVDMYPEDVLSAIEYSFFTLNPNDEAGSGEEGEGGHFFFCVLKTIGDLFRYARIGRDRLVVFDNSNVIS